MNFFNVIQNILFFKKEEEILDGIEAFNAFMTNRWGSFYSKDVAEFINNTTNRIECLSVDKKENAYELLMGLYPKLPYKRIKYVKKSKHEEQASNTITHNIANSNMISVREVEMLTNNDN